MSKVVIAGCGDLGCRLAALLHQQGDKVVGIRRRPEQLPAYVEPVALDLTSPPESQLALEGVEYAFFILTPDKHDELSYHRTYSTAQRHFLKLLQGQPIKRYFFISSTSVFGQSDGAWVDETSPVEATHFASRVLIEAENLAWESGLPATVVRFGGLYGPGRAHLLDMVRSGKAHCMEGVYSNRIHIEDAARMLAHLQRLPRVDNLYVGVDNQPTPLCDVYEWLAEQLSVPLEIDHREPTERVRQQRGNKRISNARIRETGFVFKYLSYKEGYAELIAQAEKHKVP